MIQRDCPDSETLLAFATGDLTPARLDAIADHVSDCEFCEHSLQDIDDSKDALTLSLQSVSRIDAAGPLVIPAAVKEAARQICAGSRSGTGSSVTIDPGKRYARLLTEGPVLVDRFELQAELGTGSFGYVFRARDTELDRTVAVKIQRAGAIANDEDAARFLREARSAAQLEHPGIVSLYETGQTEDGVCFLVTEFVDGETLEERSKQRPVSPSYAAEIVSQIGEALEYAHQRGIVHRDIKPSNILIDRSGHPHIMDFGLARRDTGDQTLTSDGRVMGTPAYMSPEQARGDSHDVDARSDLYSLGVILYELLTAERPFQGNRRMLLLQVLEDEPRPPRQLNDSIPRDLETICLKAMSKSPGRRYQSGGTLADDLRRYLHGEPIAARPIGTLERLGRWCRRYPIAAALFVALVVGSGAGFWHLFTMSTWFVHQTALDGARHAAVMMEEFNAYYSDVIRDIDKKAVPVSYEYRKRKGCLPLPATATIDLGERISRSEAGIRIGLVSDFPWRSDARQKTDFEKVALSELRKRVENGEDDLSYYEFDDDNNMLLYAKGQLMKQSCVQCHKQHKASPKKDWAKGDLAGALVVMRPLKNDIDRTQNGLRGAFILMAAVAGVLGALGLASVGTQSRRRLKGRSG